MGTSLIAPFVVGNSAISSWQHNLLKVPTFLTQKSGLEQMYVLVVVVGGAKSTEEMLFQFSWNLYFRPEWMYEQLFRKTLKLNLHFGQSVGQTIILQWAFNIKIYLNRFRGWDWTAF